MKYLILISLSFVFFSCKKDKVSNTIKGQYISCTNAGQTPVANSAIDLFQQKGGSNNNSKVLSNTTTDALGNFSFTYTTDNNNDKLIIRESSGNGFNFLISNIPVGQNISDIKIYLGGGRYNLVVGLNVTNAYTNLDTLFVKDFRGGIPTPQNINGLPVPGPFTNRRLYHTSMSLSPNLIYGENIENIGCNLNRQTNNLFGKQFSIQNSKVCGDTVYVSLDIR